VDPYDEDPSVSDGAPVGSNQRHEEGRFDHWRQRSTLGAVGTAVARGLHAALTPPVDEVVIVASAPGDPPDADEHVRVVLDPDDPTKSVAIMPRRPVDPS
jgi:hypothetical protein